MRLPAEVRSASLQELDANCSSSRNKPATIDAYLPRTIESLEVGAAMKGATSTTNPQPAQAQPAATAPPTETPSHDPWYLALGPWYCAPQSTASGAAAPPAS